MCFTMVMGNKFLRVVSILFLGVFAIATLQVGFGHGKSDSVCIETEKNALLVFKNDLEDHLNRLSSWSGEEDCCNWVGVVCNNITGHVQELHLDLMPPLDGYLSVVKSEAYERSKLGGNINPSLLELKYLSYLNLSGNNFEGIQIPKFLGSMMNLRYLDLYENNFLGLIPHELGNLSSLCYLRVSGYHEGYVNEPTLYADDLQWLFGLSNLEHLGLYNADLSRTSDWLQTINMLPTLSELHLSCLQLDHIPSLPHINFTSLVVLDLSGNSFTSVPKWVFNLGSLSYLDLSDNTIVGVIPSDLQNMTGLRLLDISSNSFDSANIPTWLFNFSHLEYLGLGGNSMHGIIPSSIGNLTSAILLVFSNNELEGTIPRSLGNLCNLKTLDLNSNHLDGEVSQVLESLSGCTSHSLESLDLGTNNFSGELTDELRLFRNLVEFSLPSNSISGPIPESLGSLTSLRLFSLPSNSISGPIPESLGSLTSLRLFDVGDNRLNGTLPESIGHLINLEALFISDNLLEGVVSETHFTNLTNLKGFDASGNRLALKVDLDWIPPFQLEFIGLRSWHLSPQFPKWLNSQKDLRILDLSCTGIYDTIPTWFWNISARISDLNLSHNQIYGEIPQIIYAGFSDLAFAYLSSNQFSGPLPLLSSNVPMELYLSNNSFSGNLSHFFCNEMGETDNVEILHLGDNLLSGEIPNCWKKWPSLKVLNLENNNLTGNIPSSIGSINGLQSLHLRNNSFSGNLPLSLRNCTWLVTLDLGENEFEGSIPAWIGSTTLPYLMVLNLRSNNFNGDIPPELCNLSSLQILDLANNKLSGIIPRCVNNLEAMATKRDKLQKSYYSSFEGGVIENAFVMAKGREVEYDTILSLVASFDISSNNLSGEIPEELTRLFGLLLLNLSNNYLTGKIPQGIGGMVLLESLDLSRNKLSGDIPLGMSSLTFLGYLNLSYNNLSGRIPSSTQLQSFNDSSFFGNQLCGPPLTMNCSVNGVVEKPPNDEHGGDQVEYQFYLSMALGFVVGFWGVFGPILFKRSWRYAYFLFVDLMWYKLCGLFCKRC